MLNEATADEQGQLRQWLAMDSANLAYYTQLKRIWEDSRQLALSTTVDETKAWQRFQERIHAVPTRRKSFGWIRIAATVIIIAGIGMLAYLTSNQSPEQLTVTALQTVLNDTLPDGSVVTVNKGSAISYPGKFKGDTRQVKLEGEAFFHVTPNKEQPFIVSVNDVQVTVVGTSFNIKTINGNTEVIVESGIVRVTKAGKTVELRANEKLLVSGNDAVLNKEPVVDHLYNYYRTRQFVCEDTPLWKLVEVINEAYGSKIIIEDPELRNLLLTTTFDNESLDQVLNIISITFSIEVRKEGDTILLKQ
jgi:transmembrane sensor